MSNLDRYKCKCDRGDKCDAAPMDMETVLKFEGMERELGEKLHVNSAQRCGTHNEKVGGAPGSMHLVGKAIDASVRNAEHRAKVMLMALKHKFTGIGVPSAAFIHLDSRPGPLKVFGY